ncbi:50S ribosomal protein L6 [bacterium]|nr:50S ribosomal protein L6 [bacterium]
MSRIGKQPIKVPDGVTVNITGQMFTAKSSKGELKVPFSEAVEVKVSEDRKTVTVAPVSKTDKNSALWGLTRALISNAVKGLHKQWTKELEIRGVGYRALLKGKNLDIQVGHSHPVVMTPPHGISFEVAQESLEGQTIHVIKVTGIDKQLVGDVSAEIHALKPPEPYKGKGIRYRGEYVRRKAGKAAG